MTTLDTIFWKNLVDQNPTVSTKCTFVGDIVFGREKETKVKLRAQMLQKITLKAKILEEQIVTGQDTFSVSY